MMQGTYMVHNVPGRHHMLGLARACPVTLCRHMTVALHHVHLGEVRSDASMAHAAQPERTQSRATCVPQMPFPLISSDSPQTSCRPPVRHTLSSSGRFLVNQGCAWMPAMLMRCAGLLTKTLFIMSTHSRVKCRLLGQLYLTPMIRCRQGGHRSACRQHSKHVQCKRS